MPKEVAQILPNIPLTILRLSFCCRQGKPQPRVVPALSWNRRTHMMLRSMSEGAYGESSEIKKFVEFRF